MRELLPFDLTALLVAVALMATGILTPAEGLSGLSSPATVTIGAMFVISATLQRTGVLDKLASLIGRLGRHSTSLSVLALFVVVGVASGFINNTAVVAIFIPVVIHLAPRLDQSASRLLMPLSFVAIFGGVCTLIGTSTNLAINSISVERGLEPIGMFELLPLGSILFGVGLLYTHIAGPKLLPAHPQEWELTKSFEMGRYLTDVTVGHAFSERDQPIDAQQLTEGLDLEVLEVFREGEVLVTHTDEAVWRRGDVVRLLGRAEEIDKLLSRSALVLRPALLRDVDLDQGENCLVEAIIAPETRLVGESIGDVNFYERFGAWVLAIKQRGGVLEHDSLRERRLRGGDALLLLVNRDRLRELKRSPFFLITSQVERRDLRRAPVVLAVLAGVVLSSALGLLPVSLAALLGCALLVLTGCINTDKAYDAINWKVIFLLVGVLPLGIAMEKTGTAKLLAENLLGPLVSMGPHALLAGLVSLAMLMTNVMTNLAAAAFLVPIAIELAVFTGVDPRPMVMAVVFGTSLSFMTPIGYQTNTLVYEPGQYSFSDYLRFGTPLSVVVLGLLVMLIPWLWPF